MSATILPFPGDCDDCCHCDEPQLMVRTASATGSKYGWEECAGAESTPPKLYLTLTLAGSLTGVLCCIGDPDEGNDCTIDVSGSYSASPGILEGPVEGWIPAWPDTAATVAGCTRGETVNVCDWAACASPPQNCALVKGTPTHSCNSSIEDLMSFDCSGSACGSLTSTLSDEYTTAALRSAVAAVVPSFSGSYSLSDFTDVVGTWVSDSSRCSIASLDETSATVRKLEYYWRHPVPGNGKCYMLEWEEVACDADGLKQTVLASKNYQWDGVVPVGYDAGTPSTWPTSGVYTMPAAGADYTGYSSGIPGWTSRVAALGAAGTFAVCNTCV